MLVGPSVLEIISSLLNHLEQSVNNIVNIDVTDGSRIDSERDYQQALISALGEYASHLPDFQKIEIMVFILNKVPKDPAGQPRGNKKTAAHLQNIMLRSLLEVG